MPHSRFLDRFIPLLRRKDRREKPQGPQRRVLASESGDPQPTPHFRNAENVTKWLRGLSPRLGLKRSTSDATPSSPDTPRHRLAFLSSAAPNSGVTASATLVSSQSSQKESSTQKEKSTDASATHVDAMSQNITTPRLNVHPTKCPSPLRQASLLPVPLPLTSTPVPNSDLIVPTNPPSSTSGTVNVHRRLSGIPERSPSPRSSLTKDTSQSAPRSRRRSTISCPRDRLEENRRAIQTVQTNNDCPSPRGPHSILSTPSHYAEIGTDGCPVMIDGVGIKSRPAPHPQQDTWLDPATLLPCGYEICDGDRAYVVESKLGEGGYGRVYKARSKGGGIVAVKVQSKADLAGHMSLARADFSIQVECTRRQVPFITHLLRSWSDERHIYFVMVSLPPSYR